MSPAKTSKAPPSRSKLHPPKRCFPLVFVLVRATSTELSQVTGLVEAGNLTRDSAHCFKLSLSRLAHETLEGRPASA